MANLRPNIIDNEELFNVIVLAGKASPGIVTITGADSIIEWDVKVGWGVAGATTTIRSVPPPKFECSFELFRDAYTGVDSLTAWDDFQALIDSTLVGSKPKALPIYHPDLARNKITSVCKARVASPVYDKKGGAIVKVEFQTYRPPRKQTGTVVSKPKPENDPNAAAKAEIEKLTNQYKATPWG
jgi:hypothetical protein